MKEWFPEIIIEQLRREIASANNNEVFFCADMENGRISRISVMAKGNSNSVPAVVRPEMGKRLLVIHNHPSGDLTPSGADITAASRLARDGIGFAIVNNDVTDCYTVVAPAEQVIDQEISLAQIEDTLAPGGYVDRTMESYESRPQQIELAINLGKALNESSHALAEAGTGTGKSLAYLVPILLWAQENMRRAIVSTNTINLQEQLIYKDIPLLQKAMPGSFKAVLVKGRSNYLCRRKLRELLQQGEDMVDEKDLPFLQDIMAWERQTKDGSKSDLCFSPSLDLWDLICSDSDACLRIQCKHFRDCFFHGARREALDAHLLVVNHSLLFADIALRNKGADTGVLPEYHCIVFDEAHNLEKVATDWLGARITRLSFSRLLARLWASRSNKVRGLLAVIEQKLLAAPELNGEIVHNLQAAIHDQLVPDIIALGEHLSTFFSGVVHFFDKQDSNELKIRLTEQFVSGLGWEALKGEAKSLMARLDELDRQLESLYNRLENLGPQGFELVLAQVLELNSIKSRLDGLRSDLREVLFGEDTSLVRWVELGRSKTGPRAVFNFAPLSVSNILHELWGKYGSVIFTSATLSVGESFEFVRDRLGLSSDLSVRELKYSSPFDYQRRVLLGIPTDLPSPEERHYSREVFPAVLASIAGSKGRALVLFTSFSLLNATAAAIRSSLGDMGISLLCQGEMSRHMLLDRFRADTRSVLLATASFWEGVDVAGESLSNVILTRLPFTVPDEPVAQARMEELRRQGKNPFYCYQLPQAVLRFKQGFGRLIRSKEDMGVVLVLDKRIILKPYGRWFIEALPDCQKKSGPLREVLEWHRIFLQ